MWLTRGESMNRIAWWASALAALCMGSFAAAQDWIALQDGKSLAGWKAPERPESWEVEDGAFVTRGDRSHLYYVGKVGKHDFRNFEFSAEVMTSPGANSGIYVHTKLQPEGWPAAGYELQVINSNPPAETMNGYIEHKMTGSIYAVRNTWIAPAKDNEWFSYRIRVAGQDDPDLHQRQVDLRIRGTRQCLTRRRQEGSPAGVGHIRPAGARSGQCREVPQHEGQDPSRRLAPPAGLVPIADAELDQLVSQASNDNIPLIDLQLAPPSAGARRRILVRRASLRVTPPCTGRGSAR